MVSEHVSIADLRIHTFAPMQDGQPFIAKIGDVGTMPIFFTGKSAMQAYAAADKWRRTEMAKVAARQKPYEVFPRTKEIA